MKIVVINGTPMKGVTNLMKAQFLSHLKGNEVAEFYPKDMPPFCVGCKNCFVNGVGKCPHYQSTQTIWNAMQAADLLVFAYPVYALRVPASIKSLLDHLCVRWVVHRPEATMFQKTAVIITNSVGAPNSAAQKDVKTSLSWMGVSKVYTCGAGMMGDVFVDKMTEKHKQMLTQKMQKIAGKVANIKPREKMSLKVRVQFAMGKIQHKMVLKTEATPCLDNQHYLDNGWITR